MSQKRLNSFTLSEVLVVLIITAIIIGIGFSVLRLVQREVLAIQRNFEKRTAISLFCQRISQDFDRSQEVANEDATLWLYSATDTVRYNFYHDYILRNSDTIPLKAGVKKKYLKGEETSKNRCDAVVLSLEREIPDYYLFLNSSPDAALYLNKDEF